MNRLVLVLSVTAALVLAACGSSPSTVSPSPTVRPVTTVVPSTAPSSVASVGSQTDTPWGRIWDTLPPGFPPVPGSTPSDEAATGAASATLVVDGNAARSIATSLRTALEAAGFRTEALSGPLEDGTYVLESVGTPTGCKVEVKASPLGSVTTVTVMYGSVCPHG